MEIKTPSRLHLGLIDMEGGLGRVDGGIGIALEEPGYEISFEKDSEVNVSHMRNLQEEALKLAEMICSELRVEGVDIEIKKTIPEHVGFGSKTQLSLAIASGIYKVYDIHKPVLDIAKLVGRGGTSGIGVKAFEEGGFILDGGHSSDKGFAPSRFSDASPPPILARYDFPWWLVCAWPEGKGAHGEREMSIFEKNCPIPAEQVERVSRLILMKILPALVEKDIGEFGQGINMLQETGFKKIEIGLQDPEIWRLLEFMQKNSVGGGMSSFGPVCFGVCETMLEAQALEKKVKEQGFNVIATKANNEGAKWL